MTDGELVLSDFLARSWLSFVHGTLGHKEGDLWTPLVPGDDSTPTLRLALRDDAFASSSPQLNITLVHRLRAAECSFWDTFPPSSSVGKATSITPLKM